MARERHIGERIMGVETEFGCLVKEDGTPEAAVELIKDYVFRDAKLGALDLHSRDDVFEPAQSGGFLLNGGRLYIDAVGSHLEYATAECRRLKDVIANDRAGQRLIVRAIQELELDDTVSVYNNSVDHFGGHTFGCHENYLVQMTEDFFSHRAPLLIPFLVTRQIFAGVGRVGGHLLAAGGMPDYEQMMENPVDYIWVSQIYDVLVDPTVNYQLSQRADHILKTIASRVRFNRAIINPKWEHFYAHQGMHRLHILFGESNQSEYAYALKLGTTSLVLRLLEDELIPEDWLLAHPLLDLRSVSRDEEFVWKVVLCDESETTAVDLQRRYLELAQRYAGTDEDTDWTLREWEAILTALETRPLELGDRLDWVAKRNIVEMYRQQEGLEWSNEALISVDLEYHNIDPEQSLYHAYATDYPSLEFCTEADRILAMTDPPTDTRAAARSRFVAEVLKREPRGFYGIDWNAAIMSRQEHFDMPDPFDTYEGLGA